MTEVLLEIPRTKWPEQRELKLDKGTRDAARDLARRLWPHHTAKLAARAWSLSLDEARHVVEGKCSLNTYDKIIKNGGLPIGIAILEIVTGEKVARYFTELGASYETNGKRLRALVGSGGPMAPPGRPDPSDHPDALDDRERSFTRRAG